MGLTRENFAVDTPTGSPNMRWTTTFPFWTSPGTTAALTTLKSCLKVNDNYLTYVTAAGWRAGNTRFTFVLAGVGSDQCTHRIVTATRSSVMVMNTISTLMGGHALASPKGGGPCSLSTFNYGVASHLAFRLT